MSRGAWVLSQPDEALVESVPMPDEAQRDRWYQSWAVLDGIMSRMDVEHGAFYEVGVEQLSGGR